jgi:hypothetical protein
MLIVKAPGRLQAPSGAACRAETATSGRMPLLTELEKDSAGWRFYKHGAPDGAFPGGGIANSSASPDISHPARNAHRPERRLQPALGLRTPQDRENDNGRPSGCEISGLEPLPKARQTGDSVATSVATFVESAVVRQSWRRRSRQRYGIGAFGTGIRPKCFTRCPGPEGPSGPCAAGGRRRSPSGR